MKLIIAENGMAFKALEKIFMNGLLSSNCQKS